VSNVVWYCCRPLLSSSKNSKVKKFKRENKICGDLMCIRTLTEDTTRPNKTSSPWAMTLSWIWGKIVREMSGTGIFWGRGMSGWFLRGWVFWGDFEGPLLTGEIFAELPLGKCSWVCSRGYKFSEWVRGMCGRGMSVVGVRSPELTVRNTQTNRQLLTSYILLADWHRA